MGLALAGVVLVRVGGVGASGGRGPAEDAGAGLGEGPAGVLLEAVVAAADGAEVAGAGQPALVEWDRVVEVGAPGGLAAAGAAAGGGGVAGAQPPGASRSASACLRAWSRARRAAARRRA